MNKKLLSILAGSLLLTSQPTQAISIKGVPLSRVCLAAVAGGSVVYTGYKFIGSSFAVARKTLAAVATAVAKEVNTHIVKNIIPIAAFTVGSVVAAAAAIIFRDQLCDVACNIAQEAPQDAPVAVDAIQS